MIFKTLTTEREKVIESYPFKRKVKEPYQMKIKPNTMTKDNIELAILNILTFEEIIKYEMLGDSMSYK